MQSTINYVENRSGRAKMKFTFAPESKPLQGYTIKRAIQRGGFGEVYYALSDAGKEVALKLVQQNMDVELRGVSQCLNLKHPNLVTIFDIRTDADGDHWVVMEYVSGQNLRQVLAEYPQGLPLSEIRRWLIGIAAGAGFLHDRGIVHRDLKPANVHIENGIVKIGDVGLSKFISPSRRSAHTQSVGTVYYMAPEVAHGRYGREVDVYSLGVMLYEMLTGRVPFDGETAGEILMKHLTERPDLSRLPPKYRQVLARALEKDPQRRTPNVKTLAQEFSDADAGRDQVAMEIPEASFAKSPADTNGPPNGDSANGSEYERPSDQASRARQRPVAEARTANRCDEAPWQSRSSLWSAFIFGFCGLFAFASMIGRGGMSPFRVIGLAAVGIVAYLIFAAGSRRIRNAGRSSRRYGQPPPSTAPVSERNHDAQPVHRAAVRHHLKSFTPDTRRTISWRQRITELTGSMAFASLCTVMLTVGLCFLTSIFETAGAVGLFGMTTLLGSWAVLLGSKIWEGRPVDAFPRRMTMLALATMVGGAAYWLDGTLMVELASANDRAHAGVFTHLGPQPLLDGNAEPTLTGYLALFGSLFFLRRWWWHADSFRVKRLRVMSLLLTLLLAYVVSMLWGFPASWSMLWAVAISSVVQLSSVWVPGADRPNYMHGGPHAF